MTKSARPYLVLIEQALDQIDEYRPATQDDFLDQQMIQDAILMRLQQTGENLVKIRDLDAEEFDHAPKSWHKLIGLRNVISHGYDTIKPDVIWRIVNEELPLFRATIESALEQLPPD